MSPSFTSLPTWILSSAASRAHHVLHEHLAAAGATGYEYRCLAALAATDPLAQVQLGASAALDPRDVTHTVRSLERRGLVSRSNDPGHGRRILVSLTPDGRAAFDGLSSVMAQVQERLFGVLSTAERSTLLELLARIR